MCRSLIYGINIQWRPPPRPPIPLPLSTVTRNPNELLFCPGLCRMARDIGFLVRSRMLVCCFVVYTTFYINLALNPQSICLACQLGVRAIIMKLQIHSPSLFMLYQSTTTPIIIIMLPKSKCQAKHIYIPESFSDGLTSGYWLLAVAVVGIGSAVGVCLAPRCRCSNLLFGGSGQAQVLQLNEDGRTGS